MKNAHSLSVRDVLKETRTSADIGLSQEEVAVSRKQNGKNAFTKAPGKKFFVELWEAATEPMLVILFIAWFLTLGNCIGEYVGTGKADFTESIGIFVAIMLSISITIIMEGRSKRAFEKLGEIYSSISVRALRGGIIELVPTEELVVGDIVLLSSGDKVAADGRLLEADELALNESMLTGESRSAQKDADKILPLSTPLAERKNMVFSGTFASSGSGRYVVTSVGNSSEIGLIAGELKEKGSSPLQDKLASLGKLVTVIGAVAAAIVFICSVLRLAVTDSLNFSSFQECFLRSIVLIVAAVPEGLPTIVAISLTLNVLRLAKENALIKKLVSAETIGSTSVICSDKTGTLTENKMTVERICRAEYCALKEAFEREVISQNICINTVADIIKSKGKYKYVGSSTECALLAAYQASGKNLSYLSLRRGAKIISREPFSSKTKYMRTVIETEKGTRALIKGAPEIILEYCDLSYEQRRREMSIMERFADKGKRLIAFAHADGLGKYNFDGYAVITDPVRIEAYAAVRASQKAGIRVMMLTGDNLKTATSIGLELGIIRSPSEAMSGGDLEKMSDADFNKAVKRVGVVARSTPLLKLRVVRVLKELGEVVAVTGDGINDAPAIKQADTGIAMGTGQEIAKEASDIVLLDDSFSTIVKAVSFGRNMYRNFQKFIFFQLSVNFCALLATVVSSVCGLKAPFTAIQLLWVNIIMDGPPALTLGFEREDGRIMNYPPVKKDSPIVTEKMLLRIVANGLYMGSIILLQYFTNFLRCSVTEVPTVVFTLFVLFQLFNAFNAREIGLRSIFLSRPNGYMLAAFAAVFAVQVIVVSMGSAAFSVVPLSMLLWLKLIAISFSVIVFSEGCKAIGKTVRNANNKRALAYNKTYEEN